MCVTMCEQCVLGEGTYPSTDLSLSTSPPQWLSAGMTRATQYEQAEMGKTEISLMHFSVSKHT